MKSVMETYEITGPNMLARQGVLPINEIYFCADHEGDAVWTY